MPLYICNAKKDALNADTKQQIARDITDIHCSVTGAPEIFVHVAFFEEVPFVPMEGNTLFVRGTIRKGRTDEKKNEIASRIRDSLVKRGGIEASEAGTEIRETPASWVLEGGEIMPEPGQEAEWFAEQEARRAAAET